MAGDACDVCNRGNVVGVCSSSLGPISFAYCRECVDVGAEPYWLLKFQILMCGGSLDNMREDLRDLVSYRDGKYLTAPEVEASITEDDRAKYEAEMEAMRGPPETL